MNRRRICIITGSRAEYGHLRWLARDIADDPDLCLQFMVTGSHLSPHHGMTRHEIEADGFTIDAAVEMLLTADSNLAVAKSVGLGTMGMADALDRLSPDIVVILGDRFEMLAAAQAALLLRVPIAHIHGGELTEGAFDEAIRHAITKMASLHFSAAQAYARRIIQLGEAPARVFDFGAPGLDTLLRQPLMPREELACALGMPLDGTPFLLVTYHPATFAAGDQVLAATALTVALEHFSKFHIILTGVNADPAAVQVAQVLRAFAERHVGRVTVIDSLGQYRYLSALKHAAAVVGNSSSGLIEAPALGTPTVNIGNRQGGRLRAQSVIDCGEDSEEIIRALTTALTPSFQQCAAECTPPYGKGGASALIKGVLKTVSLDGILLKRFHDLSVDSGPDPRN